MPTALGKRYGSRWALQDCSLELEPGSVTALVGPNGAGKTTLLQLAVGLGRPSAGTVRVLGHDPLREAGAVLPRIGFVAQDHPLYRGFSVAETLRLGRKLNPSWDDELARDRIEQLGVSPRQKVGKLSGGQQAQVALTLALAKRPELLLLDEPVASLDPLARREFLQSVMEAVAETRDDGDPLLAHRGRPRARLRPPGHPLAGARPARRPDRGARRGPPRSSPGRGASPGSSRGCTTSSARATPPRQTTLLVRANGHVYDSCWELHEVHLEEIVLAYLGRKEVVAG